MHLLLWGQSSYETDADMKARKEAARSLGFDPTLSIAPAPPVEPATVLVVNSKMRVDDALLTLAPALRLVVTTTSGYDHIDLESAKRKGVAVARCPLARRDAVIETSLAMGLALLRQMPWAQSRARAGVWARGELPSRAVGSVQGLRVGVIGGGVIGSKAANVWSALGAAVTVADPAFSVSPSSRDVIVSSDLVTLHCSLTESSRRLIDGNLAERMRPGVIILNTARGNCLDLEPLLESQRIGGLGLDVFPQEPWPGLAELAHRNDVLISPHSAGYYDGLTDAVTRELHETLRAWRRGEELPYRLV
jgi:phosphoglycerate dehydrogenase-like enzyme